VASLFRRGAAAAAAAADRRSEADGLEGEATASGSEEAQPPAAASCAATNLARQIKFPFLMHSASTLRFIRDRLLGRMAVAYGLVDPRTRVLNRPYLEERLVDFYLKVAAVVAAEQLPFLRLAGDNAVPLGSRALLQQQLQATAPNPKGAKAMQRAKRRDEAWTASEDADLTAAVQKTMAQLDERCSEQEKFLGDLCAQLPDAKGLVEAMEHTDYVESSGYLEVWKQVALLMERPIKPEACRHRWIVLSQRRQAAAI
jgi:hypothetical protein